MTNQYSVLSRSTSRAALVAAAMVVGAAATAEARITRIEITRVEPAFGGSAFGSVGPYDKLVGRAYGEVDPDDEGNEIIQDIELAPRNARGNVEYAMDVYLLAPHDPARGNGTILYDVVNRGNKNAAETARENGKQFRALRDQHSAVESVLNSLDITA